MRDQQHQGLSQDAVKRLRRLHRPASRRKEQRYLVQGRQAVDEALHGGALPVLLAALADSPWRPPPHHNTPLHRVDTATMVRISTLDTPPEVLAVLREPVVPFPFAPWPRRMLMAHGLQDPGNLGTVLRASVAFGVHHVVLLKGCTDPYAPKVVRATAGLLPRLTVAVEVPPGDAFAAAGAAGARIAALAPEADAVLTTGDGPTVLLVGSEGRGLAGLDLPPDARVRLPGADPQVPLNAAQAATLALYVLWGQP